MSFPNTNKYYGSQKGLPIFLFCPLHFSLQCGKIEICRYSIAVITSVSQTEEAGSTPVICSSAERARAVSRFSFSEPRFLFRALSRIKIVTHTQVGNPRRHFRVSLNVERGFFSAHDIISKPHHDTVEPAPRSYGALFCIPSCSQNVYIFSRTFHRTHPLMFMKTHKSAFARLNFILLFKEVYL